MFLKVNGHTVFVLNASPARRVSKAGRRERSFRGQQRDARRHVRRAWDMQAVILEEEDAVALKGLLWGLGHHISFADGLQASTGLKPVPGYGSLRVNAAAWGICGRGILSVPAISGTFLRYDAQLRDDEWTVLWATFENSSWSCFAKRSDGVGYVNGVQLDTVGELSGSPDGIGIRVTDGVVELINNTASRRTIDDVVILPYKMTNSMLASVSDVAVNGGFGPCPVLLCGGDFFDGRSVFCVAEVTGSGFTGKPSVVPGLGWVSNAQVVSFRLMELDPGFVRPLVVGGLSTPNPEFEGYELLWWYEAQNTDGLFNASITPNSQISSWFDRGTRSQDLNQGTAGFQPKLIQIGEPGRINSAAAVLFDGADDFMQTSVDSGQAGDLTMACVFRANVTGVAGVIVDGSGAQVMKLEQKAGVIYQASRGGAAVTHPTQIPVAGDWVASIVQFSATATRWSLNEDEAALAASGTDTPEGVTVGADSSGADMFPGYVVELLVWSGLVPIETVQAFLVQKYGHTPQT